MSDHQHITLPGSARIAAVGTGLGPVDPAEQVDFTVVLRRKADLPRDLVEGPQTISPAELADQFGAEAADIDQVRSVFAAAGVSLTDVHHGSRRLSASGPAAAVQALFDTRLMSVRSIDPATGQPVEHRTRTGDLRVPSALSGIVVAVLGLDSRPQARAQVRPLANAASGQVSYAPPALGTVYGFPAGTDGTGQTAAIIELGGGFAQSDLDTYFGGLHIPTPTVTAVGVGLACTAVLTASTKPWSVLGAKYTTWAAPGATEPATSMSSSTSPSAPFGSWPAALTAPSTLAAVTEGTGSFSPPK